MKKITQASSVALTTAFAWMLMASRTLAAPPAIIPKAGGTADIYTVIAVINDIITWLLALAGALAVAYLIWAGIQYITGGPKGAEAAKQSIINAIIGIVVIVLAYVIISAVVNLLGGSVG